ncbi:MAG: winged helix-turn-helix domain-containing protein [Eggerthella lenta]
MRLTRLVQHPRSSRATSAQGVHEGELFEIAWNEESAVEEKAINVHVSNIRSKLRAAHSAGEIETVWGIGFKLAE